MPLDFRFDAHNGADLRMQTSFLLGNEVARLTNIRSDSGRLDSSLACLKPLLYFELENGSVDVVPNLDTVVLIPDEATLYQVWRGTLGLARPDASDVKAIRIEYAELPLPPAEALAP